VVIPPSDHRPRGRGAGDGGTRAARGLPGGDGEGLRLLPPEAPREVMGDLQEDLAGDGDLVAETDIEAEVDAAIWWPEYVPYTPLSAAG